MAYTQEALQQYPKALYHLTEHYLETQDPRTWEKITQLSLGHRLEGYTQTEWEQLSIILLRYLHLIWGAVLLLWCYFLFVCCLKRRPRAGSYVGLMLSGLLLLALLEKRLWMPRWAITLKESSIHEGPSAASPIKVQKLPAGTLLRIDETKLIWTSVRQSSDPSYIRTHSLGLPLGVGAQSSRAMHALQSEETSHKQSHEQKTDEYLKKPSILSKYHILCIRKLRRFVEVCRRYMTVYQKIII